MTAEEILRLLAACAPHRRLLLETAFCTGLLLILTFPILIEPFEKRVFSPHIELDVLKTRFSMNINGLTQLQTRQITDYNAPRN